MFTIKEMVYFVLNYSILFSNTVNLSIKNNSIITKKNW